jgi:hypothetical protein
MLKLYSAILAVLALLLTFAYSAEWHMRRLGDRPSTSAGVSSGALGLF